MSTDYYTNISVTPSCSSTRWLTEEVFKLIDMVQHDEAIYNPRHKYYFCRPYVENFWREVDQKLEKNPGASLAKWTNLRISFRREYTNYLEEKVPPCWTYFDRMFFLHPYLRKKHTQPKSLDSQVQDALVRISSLSDRLHRERTAAVAANVTATLGGSNSATGEIHGSHLHSQQSHHQPLDNYLEYFDDPEHNNSDDLDDVIDDEHRSRFRHTEQHMHTLINDIKSECDDVKSDVDEYEPESAVPPDEEDNELEEMEMRNFMMDSYASSSTQIPLEERRAHLRMQQLMRLQARSYQEEFRNKRPRSQESISSTQMNHGCSGGGAGGESVGNASSASTIGSVTHNSTNAGSAIGINIGGHTRMHSTATSSATAHTNVSFVRPTLAKPLELVSTTTSNGGSGGLSVGTGVSVGSAQINNSNNDADLNASSTSSVSSQVATTSTALNQHQRPTGNAHHHHSYNHLGASGSNSTHHRLEIASIISGSGGGSGLAASSQGSGATSTSTLMTAPQAAAAPAAVAPTHVELCDCKTDPDAMFLMSLLPDIQKLNGRDRGKIKIAFQNILQDYLYPD